MLGKENDKKIKHALHINLFISQITLGFDRAPVESPRITAHEGVEPRDPEGGCLQLWDYFTGDRR